MRILPAFGLLALIAGCATETPPPERTSFENRIQPILVLRCSAGNSSGCHSGAAAAGALDVTSYDRLSERSDLLTPSTNGTSLFLAKATASIPHAGGASIGVGSDAYLAIAQWLDDGAPEN